MRREPRVRAQTTPWAKAAPVAEGATQSYRLEIGAGAASLSTARLFVRAVIGTLGLGDELADDLKLAVSEALTALITAGAAPRAVVVIDPDARTLSVGPLRPSDLPEGSDGHEIIAALFDRFSHDEQTSRLVIPLDASRSAVDSG